MNSDLRASIDIGSNSVLLLIADYTHGTLKEILKRSEITALGRDLDENKIFNSESMDATYIALKSYAEDCDRVGIPRENIIATATEAARVARNAVTFFKKIAEELFIEVNIISTQAEAYFSTKGILFNTSFESDLITLMDIGGASTELIRVNTKKVQIIESISLPIGAVRSSQWLEKNLFVQNLQKVFLDHRTELDRFQSKEIFCVAGTMTSLGNMYLQKQEFFENDVHGLVLISEDVDSLFKKFSNYSTEEFLAVFPFLQKRASSIKGGLYLVYHMIHRLLVKKLSISTYGLRYGTLIEGNVKKDFIYGKP
jgi:exopolyphosphatase/guanosine-5'-triphosphate,3'-diphosphate pyrophosphatase